MMGTVVENIAQFQQSHQTQFFYGKDVQQTVGGLLKTQATKVLLLYGQEVLRSTYWYQQLRQSLQNGGLAFVELGGIEHQAQLEKIEQGIALCKAQQVDYILAIGGGSVIDSAKAIAMGAKCDHCIWSYFTTSQKPKVALPIAILLTLPGSGSENNDQAFITNDDTLLKLSCRSTVLQPQYCFVNPQIFYTVSQPQLAQSVVMMLHRMVCAYLLLQQRGNKEQEQHRLEQRMKTLMRKARQLQVNRFDDNAWMELVLLDTQKLEGETDMEEDSCHLMVAELSAMCEVPYGAVVAVLLPAWMRFVSEKNPQELLAFAQHVMEVSEDLSVTEQIEEGIAALEEFFVQLQLENNLCALGIQEFCFKNIAQICTGYGWGTEQPTGAVQKLYWQDLYQIYQSVYQQPVLPDACSA